MPSLNASDHKSLDCVCVVPNGAHLHNCHCVFMLAGVMANICVGSIQDTEGMSALCRIGTQLHQSIVLCCR